MSESEETVEKKKLKVFKINIQKAENLGNFEMISSELAALHHFCKKSSTVFKDINQKNICLVDIKKVYIKEFSQTNEIDLFLNELAYHVDLYVFYSKEKGNYVFLGYQTKDYVNELDMGWHFKAEKECKKIMYDKLKPMDELLEIWEEEHEEEEIEPQPYVPLHCHSQYSIGDCYGKPEYVAEQAHKKGFQALAITDHGSLSGTIYMQKALLSKNIKPLIGIEAYVSFGDKKGKRHHMVILVKNEKGWKRLLKLHDISVRDNFYYKPIMPFEEILKEPEGLIVSSACLLGALSLPLREESGYPEAKKRAELLKNAFGDDFYIELMPNRIPEQADVNKQLIKLAKELDIKLIITTDSHYPNKEDVKFHKAIKAINMRLKYDDAGFYDDTFYLIPDKEMKVLIKESHPYISEDMLKQMYDNTKEIADKIKFQIKLDIGLNSLPKIEGDIRELARKGLKSLGFHENKEYSDRLEFELGRITNKNYDNYFLMVKDYVDFCKEQDIQLGAGRGSVGGSLVAYCLGITAVDPIKFNLLFDRFISEIRKDAPDIDLDFQDTRRGELNDYLINKYGQDHTAKVITFSRWHAKGIMRDIGRIFDIPRNEIEKICKLVVTRSGGDARVDFCLLDTFSEFEQAKKFYSDYKEQCDIAVGLEGNIRHIGVHAAATVVTDEPTSYYLPIHKIRDEYVTGWEKNEVEQAGVIKFDILGLKTLDVIKRTLDMIKLIQGKDVSLPTEYEDPKVYDSVFKIGNTLGIFQFETSGLSKLSKQLKIDCFHLLHDATTLYRPGALHSGMAADYVLRHNKVKEWEYDHPLLEPITKDTYGIITYQEQVMLIMNSLGGFSWATAESARKIMTKSKGKDAFEKMRKEFVRNANQEHGLPIKEAERIFDAVCHFGSYSFNLSHAVEYSTISYWCAWLKTYYPAEFFAALLSREDDGNKISDYIRDAKRFNLRVSRPDLNISKVGFIIHKNILVTGFDKIKGIGKRTSEKLIKNQPYDDLKAFLISKPSISIFRALVCSGSLDQWCDNRRYLFDNAERILKTKKRDDISFIDSEAKIYAKWDEKAKVMKELEYLDLPPDKPAIDLFDNPFAKKIKFEEIGELEFKNYQSVRWIRGIVTFINFKQEGLEGQWTMFDNVLERRYAHLNINDGTGNVLVHLSPEQYTYYKKYLERGTGFPVMIKGHSIPNFNKIYCDAMIVLNDIDYDNPVIKLITKEQQKKAKELRMKHLQYNVEIIEGVTYKVSKNKRPYARITFVGKPSGWEHSRMCFKLDKDIFVSGELLIYDDEKPFIHIVKRIK